MEYFDKILVPVDFSPSSSAAVQHAMALARPMMADVTVLHVLWEPPPYANADVLMLQMPHEGDGQRTMCEFLEQQGAQEMESFLAAMNPKWPFAVRQRQVFGDPANTVLDLMEHETFSLVVMGSHGHTRLRRMIMGSVTGKVVSHASCPVVTVRDDGALEEHLPRMRHTATLHTLAKAQLA